MTSNIKIEETITVKKQFTIDEGQLEEILLEYGRKRFGVDASADVTVTIDCSSGGFVKEVTFTTESQSVETKYPC